MRYLNNNIHTPQDNTAQMKQSMLNTLESFFMVILVFFPLRHIYWGLDLWDTGYNYANFLYMGTEHMDPMWLFSTYLANAVGHFFTGLPNGNTLVGMNFYTGLFSGILALAGYFFCTRQLKMPKVIVFFGEMVALCLCWCPTALLYNYVTYLFFLGMCICLYIGLVREKKSFLIVAGVFLGLNVLTRFANLAEAGMIVAVWAYDVIIWLEEKNEKEKFWPRVLRHTGYCLAGFLAALLLLYTYIHIRYGFGNYIDGITRLFGMTDKATDYKPTAMIMGVVGTYVEHLYWVARIGVIILGGMLAFAVSRLVKKFSQKGRILWSVVVLLGTCGLYAYKFVNGHFQGEGAVFFRFLVQVDGLILLLTLLIAALGWVEKLPEMLWPMAAGAMIAWLYANHFASMLFFSYDSMLRPGVLFLMLTMFIALIRIFHKNSNREEKLLSGMLILIIILTSLGSNNKVFPSLNNLFLAAPYTLWQVWRFVREVKERKLEGKIGKKAFPTVVLSPYPAKCILVAFLAMCFFQFGMFGAKFAFAESTGVQDISATVENNPVLKGVKMSPDKAKWLGEISEYVNENNLQGSEVILYGYVPSLSYYLQMPSAFNPWSDLLSYSVEAMEQDMALLSGQITQKGKEKPVIIVENKYSGENEAVLLEDEKWQMIVKFMEEFSYEEAFRNEKFTLYR